MKAEHRKELETNVLADRLGKMVTKVKEGPQRGTAMYVVLGIVVAALMFLTVRWYRVSKNENAEAWTLFALRDLRNLHDSYADSKPALAFQFMIAWETMWDSGIKKLGSPDQKGALDALDNARERYETLKTAVKGDPILEPEAMYALAQIEESKAIIDRAHLEKARDMYEEVFKAHPKSAYGLLAEKRVEILSDEKKRLEVADVYQDLAQAARFNRKP